MQLGMHQKFYNLDSSCCKTLLLPKVNQGGKALQTKRATWIICDRLIIYRLGNKKNFLCIPRFIATAWAANFKVNGNSFLGKMNTKILGLRSYRRGVTRGFLPRNCCGWRSGMLVRWCPLPEAYQNPIRIGVWSRKMSGPFWCNSL